MSPLALLILLVAASPGSSLAAASAAAKLDLIHSGKAVPGSTVSFTVSEINAYAAQQAPNYVPHGFRNARVELGYGSATGTALIDFLQIRKSSGQTTNWLVAKLIEGERPVKVVTSIQSAHGMATVWLRRVEIGGVSVSGGVLDFMISNFVKPIFPDIQINEAFPLMDNVERINARPGALTAQIKAAPPKPVAPAVPRKPPARGK